MVKARKIIRNILIKGLPAGLFSALAGRLGTKFPKLKATNKNFDFMAFAFLSYLGLCALNWAIAGLHAFIANNPFSSWASLTTYSSIDYYLDTTFSVLLIIAPLLERIKLAKKQKKIIYLELL